MSFNGIMCIIMDVYRILYTRTGTILEKDAYFSSLMDRHTSRLIFCKIIKYTLYYHLSPVVDFSHLCIFLLELLKVKFRRFFKLQLQLQKGCKNIKQSKLLTQKRYCQNFQRTSKHFNIEDLASDG
jgi:hypothetical protein